MKSRRIPTQPIGVRFNSDERLILEAKAHHSGAKTLGHFIRSACLDRRVEPVPIEVIQVADPRLLKAESQIAWCGNNLNQIAKQLNFAAAQQAMDFVDYQALKTSLQQVEKYLDAIQKEVHRVAV